MEAQTHPFSVDLKQRGELNEEEEVLMAYARKAMPTLEDYCKLAQVEVLCAMKQMINDKSASNLDKLAKISAIGSYSISLTANLHAEMISRFSSIVVLTDNEGGSQGKQFAEKCMEKFTECVEERMRELAREHKRG